MKAPAPAVGSPKVSSPVYPSCGLRSGCCIPVRGGAGGGGGAAAAAAADLTSSDTCIASSASSPPLPLARQCTPCSAAHAAMARCMRPSTSFHLRAHSSSTRILGSRSALGPWITACSSCATLSRTVEALTSIGGAETASASAIDGDASSLSTRLSASQVKVTSASCHGTPKVSTTSRRSLAC